LGTKLGDGATTFDRGSGRRERTLDRIGALGHGALLARRVLSLKAECGPHDGVELEEE